jgi:hypothetical protein
MGDACLASEQNFANYLNGTMQAFQAASMQSVQKGTDEDNEKDIMKLREALIDAFISILHGMNPDPEHKKPVVIPQATIDNHAQQMYYYLEALVNNTELSFNASILK